MSSADNASGIMGLLLSEALAKDQEAVNNKLALDHAVKLLLIIKQEHPLVYEYARAKLDVQ